MLAKFLIPSHSMTWAIVLGALFLNTACTKVKLNNKNKPSMVAKIQQLGAVSVTSAFPNPIAPGDQLTLTGQNFFEGMQILVGGKSCLSVTVVSASSATCMVPEDLSATDGDHLEVAVTTPGAEKPVLLAGGVVYRSALPLVAGFAITSGGGISTGGDIMVQASIGEPVSASIQTGSGIAVYSGIHGALYSP